jgi:O-antigen/teichoic acid export membrane protein
VANYLVADVFQIEAEDHSKTVFAFYIASLTLFFLMLNQVFNSILQGIHRFDIYSKITNFNSAAIISGNIILALNGYGLIILLGWNLLITFISCLFFIASAKRHLPEFGINYQFPKETVKTVLKFSAGVIGYQILANLFILFERGWIIRRLGAENLTYYVVPMQLAIYIHSFISSIVLVVFPLASELRGEREKLLRLYFKATKVVCFLVVFIEMTVVIHSREFLTLWLGADFAEKTFLILIIHATTFSLLAIQTIAWQMTEGLGYPQFNTFIYGICLTINAMLVIFLTADYGNEGIAFARLAGFTVMFFSLFYTEKWFFGEIQIKFWLKLTAMLGIAASGSVISQKLISYYFPLNWVWFLLSIGSGGIIYCLTLFLLGFINADEKILIRNLLKRTTSVDE